MADIEVTLEEDKDVKKDASNTDEVVVETDKTAKEPDKPVLKVEDGIAELKARLEAAEKARHEAEKRAMTAEKVAVTAKSEVEETNMHLITGAIQTLKRDSSILKANYSKALASGNYEEAANVQEEMNKLTSKLQRLEEGKSALENKAKETPPPLSRSDDVVEEFASKLSPRSADWIRRHPECVTDISKNQIMIGAHTMALGRRIPVDTPEYFEFIENALGFSGDRQNATKDGSENLQQSTGGRQASGGASPAAAPVSRASSSNGSNRPNVVKLSEAEREIAESMGMSLQDYAKNKLALQKAGKIN